MSEVSRNPRIVVMLLGSGYAAVYLADYADMAWATDVWNTGIGRYKTREEAAVEAQEWAEAEGIPYVPLVPKESTA